MSALFRNIFNQVMQGKKADKKGMVSSNTSPKAKTDSAKTSPTSNAKAPEIPEEEINAYMKKNNVDKKAALKALSSILSK